VATGLILAKGIVGHYTRDEDGDGGKAGTKRGIQQADTRFLLQSIMERFGLPIDWQMHVLLENASASLSTTDMHVFERLTGAQMDNTGLIHRRLIKSGWLEQGGQPWAKGWIESFFHLLHTTTNHLPGTVGRRYDLTPGGAEDKARYALSVCRKALAQGQSISELQLPLLTLEQYHELLDEYVTRLNWRTEHNLQGFGRVHEVELNPGEWISHDDPRAALIGKLVSDILQLILDDRQYFERIGEQVLEEADALEDGLVVFLNLLALQSSELAELHVEDRLGLKLR